MTEAVGNFNSRDNLKMDRRSDQSSRAYQDDSVKVEEAHEDWSLTRGLRISDNPTSDNLTPQETTNQAAGEMGPDGARLSRPGSSVVADTQQEVPDSFTDDKER